jgi:glutamate dehydrogenase (NAD(P)+)
MILQPADRRSKEKASMSGIAFPRIDQIGPEAIVMVADPESGLQGVLVVDSTLLGPAGGGIRMLPDISVAEVAALARAMTYKYGIIGLPRGGSKAGIVGDPAMPPQQRSRYMKAFGRALSPYLKSRTALVGPDMGVGVDDLIEIYAAAGADYPRSGLYAKEIDGLSLEFHITGHGVYVAARTAFEIAGRSFEGASVAVEGFGHVGVGVSTYAVKNGAKLVAVSTLAGAVYDAQGIDLRRLLELRKTHGDACVVAYPKGRQIRNTDIYYLPVDLLVPGARPYVITEANVARVQAGIISSGSNIPITDGAERALFEHGIISVPDFVANAGGIISSWVDYLGGNVAQSFLANERLIGATTRQVLSEALAQRINPREVAAGMVARRIAEARGKPAKSWEEIQGEIRARLAVFDQPEA